MTGPVPDGAMGNTLPDGLPDDTGSAAISDSTLGSTGGPASGVTPSSTPTPDDFGGLSTDQNSSSQYTRLDTSIVDGPDDSASTAAGNAVHDVSGMEDGLPGQGQEQDGE